MDGELIPMLVILAVTASSTVLPVGQNQATSSLLLCHLEWVYLGRSGPKPKEEMLQIADGRVVSLGELVYELDILKAMMTLAIETIVWSRM
jgi:hypothetical protein